MITTPLNPSLDEFLRLAARAHVVPVFVEVVADDEKPGSAFKKLSSNGHRFLFESTEKNDVSGRFSFVGAEPRAVIRSYGREVRLIEHGHERHFETSTSPLDEVRKLLGRYRFAARPELSQFVGGAVGFLGYDAISFFEPVVPVAATDDLCLPDMLFLLPRSLLDIG